MRYFLFCLVLLCTLPSFSLDGLSGSEKRFRLMEYNTENSFDTLRDSFHEDADFLPNGEYHWNSFRYWRKEGALARVILEAGGLQPVDVIGLCEVENDSVVFDLLHRTRLASLGYEYVITNSRDIRGIDVALLYQPDTYRLIGHCCFSVPYDTLTERPTRDILLCSGIVPTGDTLDIFLVHFPSRRGGAYLTDAYRERAASVVRDKADSLRVVRQHPKIVFMGDCNAEPKEKCLRILQNDGFFAISEHAAGPKDISGTYFYQKEWGRIDNIFVNNELREGDCNLRLRKKSQNSRDKKTNSSGQKNNRDEFDSDYHCCRIFAPDYLLEEDAEGFPVPYRMYRGPMYHGGISDHLPLILDLWY